MKNAFKMLIASVVIFASCKKENLENKTSDSSTPKTVLTQEMVKENGNNPDEVFTSASGANIKGYSSHHVYIESNAASQNAVMVYNQQSNGQLKLASTTWSGGKGAGSGLGSQGALALHKNHQWLFAVNAGSNSISSFKIAADGSLKLMHTEACGGTMPISVTVNRQLLYVVNSGSSDIMGFKITDDGMLKAIPGSYQKLSSANAGPAEIAFAPGGSVLLITEKNNNKITAFAVNSNGAAYNKTVNTSVGNTPFGFDFARDRYMIVTNANGGMAGESSVTSYKNLANLWIKDVNGKVPNQQSAVCWVAATAYGRFAYAANTGSATISTYFIDLFGNLYLIPWFSAKTELKPADIIVSGDNQFVYNISGGSHSLGECRRGFLGELHSIGFIHSLPEFAAGLIAY